MVLLQNTAEGGTAGTTVTTGNSGGASGDAFTQLVGTVTFQNVPAARGTSSRCYRADAASSYTNWTGVTWTAAASRGYFYLTANPTTAGIILALDRAANPGVRVGINTSGKFIVQNAATSTLTTSTPSVPLNTWVRIEAQALAGTSSTNGTIRVQAYVGDDTASPIWTYAGDNVNASNGTGAQSLRFGRFSGTFAGLFWDDVAAQDSFTAIGPTSTPPPTASGSGSWSFAGSATGKRNPTASGSGTWTTTGTATGKRSPIAAGTGSWTFTGTATGQRAPKATAAGSWTWAGSATGRRAPAATGSGAWSWTGTTTGKRTPAASGAGQWTFTGQAASKRTPKTTGAGAWAFVGEAAGYQQPVASGAAQWTWAGTAVGFAPVIAPPGHLPGAATLPDAVGADTLAGGAPGVSLLADPGAATSALAAALGTAQLVPSGSTAQLEPAPAAAVLIDAVGAATIDLT